jgi:hypothetical protein
MDTSQYGESAYITPELVKFSASKKVYICGIAKVVQGKFGDKLELPVEIDGKQKTWGLNRTLVQALHQFGDDKENPKDDKHWIGKWVQLSLKFENGKDVIVASPILS